MIFFSQDCCLFLFPNFIFEFLFLTLHYVHSLWTFNLSFPIFVRSFFSFIFLWIQSNSIFFYFPHENWLWINTAYFGGLCICFLFVKYTLRISLRITLNLKSGKSFSLCQSLWWFISEQIFSRVSIICCSQKNRSQCC